MRIWINVDNPPQVQYLLPFREVFQGLGADVVVTARDYGITYDLLRERGVPFSPVGSSVGRSKVKKAIAMTRRARELEELLGNRRPNALVCASRSSALAARRLGIPSFVLGDYEYVHVAVYRLTRSYLMFPNVIEPTAFTRRGLRRRQLLPYDGLKEDITFSGLDLDDVPEHQFDADLNGHARVLVRPPAEESHYYNAESKRVTLELLRHLAQRDDAVVVLSPRYVHQRDYLDGLEWRTQPIVLETAVPFLSLLKAIDAVVSSGGTMLREAAYLGIPAFSTFRSKLGGVDRYLASINRLTLLDSDSLGTLELRRGERRPPLASNPDLVYELASTISERAS